MERKRGGTQQSCQQIADMLAEAPSLLSKAGTEGKKDGLVEAGSKTKDVPLNPK